MRKVTFDVQLGREIVRETINIPDDLTEEEIDKLYLEWQAEQLEGGWEGDVKEGSY